MLSPHFRLLNVVWYVGYDQRDEHLQANYSMLQNDEPTNDIGTIPVDTVTPHQVLRKRSRLFIVFQAHLI